MPFVPKQSILTVPLSEAKENRQDLRCHRGDGAETTGRFAQPPFHAQLQRGSTGDAAFSLRSLAASTSGDLRIK
jgi:hypothetical protein